MHLQYQDPFNHQTLILQWQEHPRGAELRLSGPGFQPEGFSIGVYSLTTLATIRSAILDQKPTPEHSWAGAPGVYGPLYNFMKPVKFANRQGPATVLAIHAEKWTEYSQTVQRCLRLPPRTVTIHEQGERTWWRWLGRYPAVVVCAFLAYAKECDAPQA